MMPFIMHLHKFIDSYDSHNTAHVGHHHQCVLPSLPMPNERKNIRKTFIVADTSRRVYSRRRRRSDVSSPEMSRRGTSRIMGHLLQFVATFLTAKRQRSAIFFLLRFVARASTDDMITIRYSAGTSI